MNPLKRLLKKREAESLAQEQYNGGLVTRFPTTDVCLSDYPKFKDDDIGVQISYEGGPDRDRDAILTAIAKCNSALSGYIPDGGLRFRWWHCKDKYAAEDLASLFRMADVQNVTVCTRLEGHKIVRKAIRSVYGPDAMASESCSKCLKSFGPENFAKPGVCVTCYAAKPMIVMPVGHGVM